MFYFYAGGFEKSDLLSEDAGAAECNTESGAGQGKKTAVCGKFGTSAGAFEQAVDEAAGGRALMKKRKQCGKQKDGNFYQFCVFECFRDDAEIGDESSHA